MPARLPSPGGRRHDVVGVDGVDRRPASSTGAGGRRASGRAARAPVSSGRPAARRPAARRSAPPAPARARRKLAAAGWGRTRSPWRGSRPCARCIRPGRRRTGARVENGVTPTTEPSRRETVAPSGSELKLTRTVAAVEGPWRRPTPRSRGGATPDRRRRPARTPPSQSAARRPRFCLGRGSARGGAIGSSTRGGAPAPPAITVSTGGTLGVRARSPASSASRSSAMVWKRSVAAPWPARVRRWRRARAAPRAPALRTGGAGRDRCWAIISPNPSPVNGTRPVEHLEQDHAQRVDVGAVVDLALPVALLGRHVDRRAHHDAGARRCGRARRRTCHQLGEAEVEHLHEVGRPVARRPARCCPA